MLLPPTIKRNIEEKIRTAKLHFQVMFEGLLLLKARKKFINLSEFVLQIYKEETEMSKIAIILWSINIKQLMHKLQGLFY